VLDQSKHRPRPLLDVTYHVRSNAASGTDARSSPRPYKLDFSRYHERARNGPRVGMLFASPLSSLHGSRCEYRSATYFQEN
jgi:hypothetical protein